MANPLKDFTIQTVLRHTSPEVLQVYLEDAALTDIMKLPPLSKLRQQYKKSDEYVESLMEKVHTLSKPDFTTLIKGMLRVYMLTRDRGRIMLAFQRRYQLQDTEEIAFLKEYKKPYDAAFMLYMRLRGKVDDYYLVFMLENQNKRYWNRRRDYIPSEAEMFTKEDVQQLKDEVKNHLQKERRGNNCEDNSFDLDGKTYVFLMADDQPIVERAWNDKNKIDDLHYIPVFQIAIVYDSRHGEVDICCENATTRLNMHRAFAKTKFLLEEIPDYPEDDTVYDLEHALKALLGRKRLDLKIPAGLAIEDIFIKAMRFRIGDLGGADILLDAKYTHRDKRSPMQPDAMYVLISSFFKLDKASPNEIPLEDANPAWIEWIAAYRDPYDPNRIIRETFTMSGKNTCNLDLDGSHGEIRTCLEHNGIIRHKMPNVSGNISIEALPAFP